MEAPTFDKHVLGLWRWPRTMVQLGVISTGLSDTAAVRAIMKAVRLIHPERWLEMQELTVPEPGPDHALVRVKAAGICH